MQSGAVRRAVRLHGAGATLPGQSPRCIAIIYKAVGVAPLDVDGLFLFPAHAAPAQLRSAWESFEHLKVTFPSAKC